MLKKIIFNIIIVAVILMIALAIIKANKPKPGILKGSLNNLEKNAGLKPREAKYYRVIEE